jgi:quercetin dioxygenase-like cupin family protein
MSETKRLLHFRSMEGKPYQVGPLAIAFKRADGEDEGSYSLFEALEPPGARVDIHRHESWQETFIVLDGDFEFEVSGERRSVGRWEILDVPRGALHGYRCTSPKAGRLLTISTPARVFEAFVKDVSAANMNPGIDVRPVFARHGLEVDAHDADTTHAPARHFGPMEGKTYVLGRMKMAFKRADGDTDGAYSIFESTEASGSGAGLHRHPPFQETFIVLDGQFNFRAAGEQHTMGPGEMLVIPRGAPHGFTCTSPEPGRLLTISTPARVFEASIDEVCRANVDTGTASGGAATDMRAIAARHGLEFL